MKSRGYNDAGRFNDCEPALYAIAEIKDRANMVAASYNEDAAPGKRLTKIELFGSYANGKARETSDLDFLVTFESDTVGLFSMADLLARLQEAFGNNVDMVKCPVPDDAFLVIDKVVPLYG